MKNGAFFHELEQLVLKFRGSDLQDETIRKTLNQVLSTLSLSDPPRPGKMTTSIDLEAWGSKVEKLVFGGVWDLDAEDDETRKVLFITKALAQRIYMQEGHMLRSILNAVISVLREAEEKGRFADSEIHSGQYSSAGQMSISYLEQWIKMNVEKVRTMKNPESVSSGLVNMEEEKKSRSDDRYMAILRQTQSKYNKSKD